jgi:hypothetical protein
MKNNKDIDAFCYYILNNIDYNVLDSLSSKQLTAIEDAVKACQLRTKHAVDIRKTINLFFMKFYFAFFIGRDRRLSVQEIEADRREDVTLLGNLIYLMFVLSALILLTVIGLYGFKTFLGIDLFPGKHMGEIFGF